MTCVFLKQYFKDSAPQKGTIFHRNGSFARFQSTSCPIERLVEPTGEFLRREAPVVSLYPPGLTQGHGEACSRLRNPRSIPGGESPAPVDGEAHRNDVSRERASAPGFATRAGPRGPSGITTGHEPRSATSRARRRSAGPPPRDVDPRTTRPPSRRAIDAPRSPSRDRLISMASGTPRRTK